MLTDAEGRGEVLMEVLYVVPPVEVVVDEHFPIAFDLMVGIPHIAKCLHKNEKSHVFPHHLLCS